MEWKDEYRVGIHEIDEQHRAVAECISDIEWAVAQGRRSSEVNASLVYLVNHVQNHVLIEESLMRTHDYPRLLEHAAEHKKFLADLRMLQEHSLTTVVLKDRVASLNEWWETHIQKHDKSYALHFLRHTALGKP